MSINRSRSVFSDGVHPANRKSPKKPQNTIEFPDSVTHTAKRLKQSQEHLDNPPTPSPTEETEHVSSSQEVSTQTSENVDLSIDILTYIFANFILFEPVYAVCSKWKTAWERVKHRDFKELHGRDVQDTEKSTYIRDVWAAKSIQEGDFTSDISKSIELAGTPCEIVFHQGKIILVACDATRWIRIFNAKGEEIKKIGILSTFDGLPFMEETTEMDPLKHLAAYDDIVFVEYRLNDQTTYFQAFYISTGAVCWEQKHKVIDNCPLCLRSMDGPTSEKNKQILVLKGKKELKDEIFELTLQILNVKDGQGSEFNIQVTKINETLYFNRWFLQLVDYLYFRTSNGIGSGINIHNLFVHWLQQNEIDLDARVLSTNFQCIGNFIVVRRMTNEIVGSKSVFKCIYYYGLLTDDFSSQPTFVPWGERIKWSGYESKLFSMGNTLAVGWISNQSSQIHFVHVDSKGTMVFEYVLTEPARLENLYFVSHMLAVCVFQNLSGEKNKRVLLVDLREKRVKRTFSYNQIDDYGNDYFFHNRFITVTRQAMDHPPTRLLASYRWRLKESGKG